MYGLEKDIMHPKSVLLDSFHSHFILIDNDCKGELGNDVEFRLQLENELRKNSNSGFSDDSSPQVSLRRNSNSSVENMSIGSGKTDHEQRKGPDKFDVPMVVICVNGGYYALRFDFGNLLSK
jgi:hypothetical protein